MHVACVLLENPSGELLVLLRQKDRPEGNKFGLPGGQIKLFEPKKDTCLKKVFNETGLKLDPDKLKFLKTYNNEWQSDGSGIKFELFRYSFTDADSKISIDPEGSTKYMWETPERLYKRDNLMKGLYIILKDVYKL